MLEQHMPRLREALAANQRVEIHRYIASTSPSYAVAGQNARDAAAANARGERVASIFGAGRELIFQCRVNAEQVLELLKLGAIEV